MNSKTRYIKLFACGIYLAHKKNICKAHLKKTIEYMCSTWKNR